MEFIKESILKSKEGKVPATRHLRKNTIWDQDFILRIAAAS